MSALPDGWAFTKFGEVFDFKGGSQPPKSSFFDTPSEGRIRLLQIRDFSSDDKAVYIEDNGRWPRCESTDIMVGRYGASIGKVLSGKSGAYNVALVKWIFDEENIFSGWVQYLLNSQIFQSPLSLLSRSAQNGFNKDDIKKFDLFLPPLAEQKRIVEKLDFLTSASREAAEALERVENLQDKLQNSILENVYRKSAKQKTVVITEVVDVVTGTTPSKKQKELYYGGTTPLFKPTDLNQHYHVETSREYLTEAGVDASRLVPKHSTLVTCIGATIGKTGFSRVKGCTNQQINALIPDPNKIDPRFLFWLVLSPTFQKQIKDNASATTMPIINKGRFQKLSIPLPSLAEQVKLVGDIETSFDQIRTLTTAIETSKTNLTKLDRAILSKAFSGNLVSQDPNDEPANKLLERIRLEKEEIKKKPKKTPVAKSEGPKAYPSEIRKVSKMNKSRFDEDVKGKAYLANILKNHDAPLTAQKIYSASGLSVADFYKQLSDEIANGFIIDKHDSLEIGDAA